MQREHYSLIEAVQGVVASMIIILFYLFYFNVEDFLENLRLTTVTCLLAKLDLPCVVKQFKGSYFCVELWHLV